MVAALTAIGVVGLAAPSYADRTVTVQGTSFPDPASVNLSLVGCADLYQRGDEQLVPRIGVGPGEAPSGTRSLGWDLAGGNAVGALFAVDSMLRTGTASMAVNSAGRATGVAYAGYQEPADAGTSLLWLGRSELVSPGGAWQTIDATTRLYTWTKYDMATRNPVAPGPGAPTTVPDFAAAHGGDGPGVYTIGFGCDGTPFSMDQLQVGAPGSVTTYDVEGLQTAVTISASGSNADKQVTLVGRLHTGTGDPVTNATMVLERRLQGSSAWRPVVVADVDHGIASATVQRDERAFYRWRFVARPLAEGSTSEEWLVDLMPPVQTDAPSPTGSPDPTQHPSDPPPSSPSPSESSPPGSTSESPTETPAEHPTESLAESASASASVSASAGPTDAPDESASPSESNSHRTR